jgi:tetratricopeptide (TPR) repeat protein
MFYGAFPSEKLLIAAFYLLLTATFLAALPNYAATHRQFPSLDNEAESAALEFSNRLYLSESKLDIAEWLKLWHENCPTIPRRKSDFLDKESIYNLKKTELKLSSFMLENGRDKVFADAEISFTIGEKIFIRQLGLIREGADWKIWHESPKEEYQSALKVANSNDSPSAIYLAENLAGPMSWIGYRFYEKSDYENSIRAFSIAIKYAKEAQDNYLLASALIQQGHSQLESNNSTAALQSYLEAERISKSEIIEIGTIRALGGMGNAYTILGEYFKARDTIKKRLAMLRINGSPRRIANTQNNLGNLYFRIGDYEAAQKALEESSSILEHPGTYLNLGYVFAEKGDYEAAQKYFQAGIKLAQKQQKAIETLKSMNGLGMLEFKKGNYRGALSIPDHDKCRIFAL